MRERLGDLPFLERALLLVGHLLEPATAALLDMRAARGNAVGRGLEDPLEARLGEAALDLRDARLDPVARQAAIHEHHATVVAGERFAAEGDVLDGQI